MYLSKRYFIFKNVLISQTRPIFVYTTIIVLTAIKKNCIIIIYYLQKNNK